MKKKQNTTFSIGNVAIIDKVNGSHKLFDKLFDNFGTKAKNIKNSAKLLVYNRLGECVSVNQLQNIYPEELYKQIGFKTVPSNRSINRDLERIGSCLPFLEDSFQKIIKENNLVSNKLFH